MRDACTQHGEAAEAVGAAEAARASAVLGGRRGGGPGAVLTLQRRAGNRATLAVLRRPPTAPRLSRSLLETLGGAVSAAWDAVQELATMDPLALTADSQRDRTAVAAAARDYAAGRTTEQRLLLIRALKRILRLATAEDQAAVRAELETAIGAPDAAAVWAEAGTAFGGYTGMYAGYAPDVKRDLVKLGASDTVSFRAINHPVGSDPATYRPKAKAAAAAEIPDLARTDIVYFRGHQYAQYKVPGMFADYPEKRRIDLRYVDQPGGFPNVKLMISTSCATLCGEAFEVFHRLFPNAVILGYRKSAPRKGELVRNTLATQIAAIGRPLLLEEPSDMAAIAAAWKRAIEQRHKGDTAQLPGYYDGVTVHYWDGSAWKTVDPLDPANACKRKRDFRSDYPGP